LEKGVEKKESLNGKEKKGGQVVLEAKNRQRNVKGGRDKIQKGQGTLSIEKEEGD